MLRSRLITLREQTHQAARFPTESGRSAAVLVLAAAATLRRHARPQMMLAWRFFMCVLGKVLNEVSSPGWEI
jgi:hypothetical protein